MDANVEAIYGLTPMQEGMLFHKIADSNDTSYHIQNSFWMNKKIDINLIRNALDLLGDKHEVFRTAFVIPKSTGVPWQVVLKNRKIELEHIDAHGSEEKDFIEKIKNKDLKKGFNLQENSLLRLIVVTFGLERHLFLFSFHHIIMDGWCLSLVFGDFMSFYNELSNGKSMIKMEELISKEKLQSCKYSEYINWISMQDKEEGLNYWKDLLADYNGTAEIKPMTKQVATEQQMDSIKTSLSKEVTEGLSNLASTNNVTMNVIAEAAWGIILQKCNYNNDVVFGKVVSGRNVPIRGAEEKVGLFINSVPLRVTCNKGTKVIELIKSLYEQGIKGNNYEYCSLAEIQRLTSQGSELIKTMFVYENYYVKEDNWNDEKNELNIQLDSAREQTNYPVSICFSLVNDELEYNIMFNPNEFVRDEINNISQWLKNVLVCIARNPNSEVSEIEIITEAEKAKILGKFNDKYFEYDKNETIVDVFEEQVAKTPDNIAAVYGEEHITYYEINAKINSIAHKLRAIGVRAGDFVAIIAKSSIETIAGIYGVIKAGGAYVPIDPTYPEDRIRYILEDCKPKIILADNSEVNVGIPTLYISDKSIWEGIRENPNKVSKPNDVAYCIYTSGTTGKPKGVMVEHKGVPNLKNYFVNTLCITDKDSVLQFANIVFDASVWEMSMALLIGAKLVIATEEERKNNYEFIKLAEREKVSVATLPPIFYTNLEGFKPRIIITAGSESSYSIVKKASENSEYINAYGPTEFTVAATQWKYKNCDEIPERVPIGEPILNTKIYILNGLKLCGIGVPGELCMTGVGLARGYLNKPELTAEKFINNPFGEGRLYRSGDLARWLPNGEIEYLGRIDEQVKIRGFRIELGDIESIIRKIEYVSDVGVVAKTDRFGENAIYAYIVSDKKIDISEIKKEIGKFLPSYMLPACMMQIDSIPVTINGKLDKRALPEIETKIQEEYILPRTEIEKVMCSIFCEVLRVEKVGIDDDFFEHGGDSLKAMKLVSKIRANGYEISINDVFSLQNVRKISENFIMQSLEYSTKEDSSYAHSFGNIEEIKQYLNGKIKAFNSVILDGEILKYYPISPMQQLSLDKNILKSGIVLDFKHEVNMEKLTNVIVGLINSQETMRSTLTEKSDKILIVEKSCISHIEIPIVDISYAPTELKKEFEEYMTEEMYGEEKWVKETLSDKLLYQIIAVKYAANDWNIFMPFCHLIFDGMSAEILRSSILRAYYNNGELGTSKDKACFSEYVEQLDKGPDEIPEDDIVEKFNLIKFGLNMNKLSEINKDGFVNSTIRLKLNRLAEEFDEKELWNISYKLFNRMICHNLELDGVSFVVLFTQRKYRNNNFYNTIGEFLDIIPVADLRSAKVDNDYIKQLLEYVERYNINFTTFMYNAQIQKKYKKIGMIFKELGKQGANFPVFNFLGLYKHGDKGEELNNLHEAEKFTMTVDVTYSENEIVIYGFSKAGEYEDLTDNLQRYLDELISSKKVIN